MADRDNTPLRPALELWTWARSLPGAVARTAVQAEAEGWDGMTFTDSQNMSGDCYVAMATAAQVTSRIRLAVGVTNPLTRHPAVTASAIACVNVESGGRAELGVGRGDSALAYVGYAPAPLDAFEECVAQLQSYLRGQEVILSRRWSPFASLDTLPMGEPPETTRLKWLDEVSGVPTVPLFVAGSGPKVIRIGARLADRVTVAVGADPDRLRWAVGVARAERPEIKVAAYVNVVVHPDRTAALELAGPSVASFARFAAMHGQATGPLSSDDRTVVEAIPRAYQMARHFGPGAQTRKLTQDFAERHAVLGSESQCIARLVELAGLGVDRLHVTGTAPGSDPRDAELARRRFVEGVVPAVREAVGAAA